MSNPTQANTIRHCAGKTKPGQPCKNYALADSEFCRIHQPQAAAQAGSAPPEAGDSAEMQRSRLVEELEALVERLLALSPNYQPPLFSPNKLIKLIEENLLKLSPELGLGILEKLRDTISSDLVDVKTWAGIWYMLNYSLENQADLLKRRCTGEYEIDEWGLDVEYLSAVRPFFEFLYKVYWRVQTSGLGNIPSEGRALLVANHSGQLPFDGAMIASAVLLEHPQQRLARTLYASWVPTLPFFSTLLVKCGQVLATEDNGIRLLEQEQLVAVFPEGIKGIGKLFKERYHLARFGRGGFIKMALKTRAPIVPIAVVGAEEIYISLHKSQGLARLTGLPYIPISLTWPWLGLLGLIPLPTKWYIDFGAPIPTSAYEPDAANDLALVLQLSDQVRDTIQQMVNTRLAQRRSIFFS